MWVRMVWFGVGSYDLSRVPGSLPRAASLPSLHEQRMPDSVIVEC